MPLNENTYHEILVGSGLLSEQDFARVRDESAVTGRPMETAVADLGLYSEEQVGRLVADAYGVKFVNLMQLGIQEDAIKTIPDLIVRKQFILPYAFKGDRLKVAMVDPENAEAIGFIEKKTGLPLDVGYVTPGVFEEALRSHAQDVVAQIGVLSDRYEKIRQGHPEGKVVEGEEALIVQVVDLILQYGYTNNASDVHIEPQEKTALVRYRVDGVLHDVLKISKPLQALIVSRVKIMTNLRTDEHFAAQDGKFRARFGTTPVDVRVSILPVVEGEKIVMRILSEKGRAFTLETLGFSEEDLKRAKAAALKPYGMILATGPTGSGKTTTMYAALKLLNSREVNIQTIEDPVEYDIDGVNQIQVNTLTNLTFANGLRSIVRQDPDIIMVGEIRDAETASISVNAAMTGHLVLSTLHTNDAATAIPRLLDMSVEPFLVASSVNVVIAQRLVRHICGRCILSMTVNVGKLREAIPPELYKKYFGMKTVARLFHGKGCTTCNKTGFSGRVGIFEVLEMTSGIRDLVMRRANADLIQEQAMKEGMTTMFEDGLRKVFQGVTTLEEVLRAAKSS